MLGSIGQLKAPVSGETEGGEDEHSPLAKIPLPGIKEVFRAFLSEMGNLRIRLFIPLVLSAVNALSVLAIPFIVGQAIDYIAKSGLSALTAQRLLTGKIFQLFVLYIVSQLSAWLLGSQSRKISELFKEKVRNKGSVMIQRLSLKTLDPIPEGEIISRLGQDTDAAGEGISQLLNQFFSAIILIVGSLYFLFSENVFLGLLTLAAAPFGFFISSLIAKYSYKYFGKKAEDRGVLNKHIDESIRSAEIIRAYNAEKAMEEKFGVLNERLHKSAGKAELYSSFTNPGLRFLNHVVLVLTAALGASLALSGKLSIGALSAALSYCMQFSKPLNEISGVIAELQGAFASFSRIIQFFSLDCESDEKPSELQIRRGGVEFKALDFSYRKDRELIKGLRLKIPPSSVIMIVGPTGAGKSTLVNLLMRFYEPDSGLIEIDGQDIAKKSRRSLRKNIGMVLQDSTLFTGTIRENISYAKPQADISEVRRAAAYARALSFIENLPEGFDTRVGEGELQLSAGEKQLICIARVLMTTPKILILDEATSEIDSRSEALIQKVFKNMMSGRTSFLISHRLTGAKDADAIIVMKDGKIAETGTHDELMKRRGFYSELYLSANPE